MAITLPTRLLILCALLLLALACAPTAAAQGLAYPPQPPSKQVLYRDGQTDRYLLGGTWLYRADAGMERGKAFGGSVKSRRYQPT